MSFSRRKFLRAGSLVAISAAFPIKSLIAGTRRKSEFALDHTPLDKRLFFSRESFARQLNTKFSFDHPEIPSATLKLVEVNDLTPTESRRSAAATGRECFAVLFKGAGNTALRQETYTVSHAALGKFEMFVVPIGHKRDGRYYEAVFNRLN
jgi:Domain of unknown function (DUF6916)